jgi:hypothetical protein
MSNKEIDLVASAAIEGSRLCHYLEPAPATTSGSCQDFHYFSEQ